MGTAFQKSTRKGVLQGDTLAPYLFIICLDYVLRTSIDKIRENGFELTKRRSKRYPAKTITDADYADDLALLANTPNQAETLLHSLERAAAGIGLHVNANKTEYMCYNQTGNIATLDGASLKLVDKFTYLGSSVSSTEKDIDTRLTKAWTAIDRLSIIWKSDLTDKMKRSFFQAAVVSILLYGCTTWTLTKRLERRLDGNYTRMLRAVLNKSWRQHPTRLQLYGHLPPITKTIQVRRTRHAGHCWRSKDELISDVLLWTPLMVVQEWDDQHELTYSSYVRTRVVILKTCRRRWMIGRNGERRSGISAQAARHDDDDDIYITEVSHYADTHWKLFSAPLQRPTTVDRQEDAHQGPGGSQQALTGALQHSAELALVSWLKHPESDPPTVRTSFARKTPYHRGDQEGDPPISGRASGKDEIYKAAGPDALMAFLDVLLTVWEKNMMPDDFRDAQIVSLYKNKESRSDCGNNRGISVLSATGKIFTRVILNRLITVSEQTLPEAQCGSRPGRNTVDMIFAVVQLQEKCIEQNKSFYSVFIDLTKALDTVNR